MIVMVWNDETYVVVPAVAAAGPKLNVLVAGTGAAGVLPKTNDTHPNTKQSRSAKLLPHYPYIVEISERTHVVPLGAGAGVFDPKFVKLKPPNPPPPPPFAGAGAGMSLGAPKGAGFGAGLSRVMDSLS